MKISALILGCGNIGSQYDLNNDFVQTHSKAMFYSDWIYNVDIYDLNKKISNNISKIYNFNVLDNYEKECLLNYDLVSICTPTQTHFDFLKDCILKKVKLVICEKPISFSNEELSEILNLYNEGTTKVLVNYYRSFQTSYSLLKKKLNSLNIQLNSVKINYYKGVLNYASHAFDLINYIFDISLNVKKLNIVSKDYDFFTDDPTINANFYSNGIKFHLNGIKSKIPVFEIILIFNNYKVIISEHGNKACIYKSEKLLYITDSLIKNYMLDVLDFSKKFFLKKNFEDNFVKSLNLNKELINII